MYQSDNCERAGLLLTQAVSEAHDRVNIIMEAVYACNAVNQHRQDANNESSEVIDILVPVTFILTL